MGMRAIVWPVTCWGLTDSPIRDNLERRVADLTRQLSEEIRESDRNRNQVSVGSGASYSAVHGFAVGTQDVTLQGVQDCASAWGSVLVKVTTIGGWLCPVQVLMVGLLVMMVQAGFAQRDDPNGISGEGAVAACCTPQDQCIDLTQEGCRAVRPTWKPRLWQQGTLCGIGAQRCPLNDCLEREGDCTVGRERFCNGGCFPGDGAPCHFDFQCRGECLLGECLRGCRPGASCISLADCNDDGSCVFVTPDTPECVGGARDGEFCDPDRGNVDCMESYCEKFAGCEDPFCCTNVCELGPGPPLFSDFCCQVEWDFQCAELAREPSLALCTVLAHLDIKPESCPNPVNPRGQGVVTVAIVGSGSPDVTQIDVHSLELRRTDGVGGSASPMAGRRGPRVHIEDVASPLDGGPCECHELGADGFDDLIVKFSTAELARTLELTRFSHKTSVNLILNGTLLDGREFSASDCILIVGTREPATIDDALQRLKPVDGSRSGR